jgi:hypothetical protein
MKGLELAEKYFKSAGLPMLREDFASYLDRMAIGLVGDGSECYGFDDAISRDHDWGPGFCIWLMKEDYGIIAEDLQKAIDRLPKTFAGYGPRIVSQWGSGRIGVFEIATFYQGFIGLDYIPKELDEWLMIPENALAACTNGKVFYDPLNEFSRWRDSLKRFYPEDVRLKKMASRCMTIGQAGQYNFPRCVARDDFFSAQYSETKFCADVISFVFLFNRSYTPFYKWMHRAVKKLAILGRAVHEKIARLVAETDFEKKILLIEEICAALVDELKLQRLSEGTSSFLADHGPEVQARIQDEGLRSRNVWVG